jgi:hypothetical protein
MVAVVDRVLFGLDDTFGGRAVLSVPVGSGRIEATPGPRRVTPRRSASAMRIASRKTARPTPKRAISSGSLPRK